MNVVTFEMTFKQYEQARYLRTGRVQTTARIYGDIYHAEGVVGELRTMMLSSRDPKNYDGVAWLYDGIQIKLRQLQFLGAWRVELAQYTLKAVHGL